MNKNMKSKYSRCHLTFLLSLILVITACEDEKYELPELKNELQNDCIKRTLGPNIIGTPIEFAYAMALPPGSGSLMTAQVEASISGAAGTFLEHRAFYTNGTGADIPVQIGDPSTTEGTFTQVAFTRDTFATTLRYFYMVPPEARGQDVTFTFSANDSNGKTVSYNMGPYTISYMDMALDRVVRDNAEMYISIADMAVYTAAQAAAIPEKIDLVYLYRVVNKTVNNATANVFGHALVSPAADPAYLPGVTLPAGVVRNTKVIKNLNLRDRHLARLQFGVYIDDIDFERLDVSTATNYALNVRNEGGVWVETEDGQYRAFVYINAITNTATNRNMTISIKRYQMF
jgi:hypothetical protein